MQTKFSEGDQVTFTNTVDDVPVTVVIVACYPNAWGGCGDPECCGRKVDAYDVRLPDGSIEGLVSDYWLEPL